MCFTKAKDIRQSAAIFRNIMLGLAQLREKLIKGGRQSIHKNWSQKKAVEASFYSQSFL